MKASNWLSRSVAILKRDNESKSRLPLAGRDLSDSTSEVSPKVGRRSIRDRLAAQLKQPNEALSPRMLRRTLKELKAVIDPQVSEVEGGRRALALAGW
jgi:malonyl-CoA decarboxylase